jgi:hypothetical protein
MWNWCAECFCIVCFRYLTIVDYQEVTEEWMEATNHGAEDILGKGKGKGAEDISGKGKGKKRSASAAFDGDDDAAAAAAAVAGSGDDDDIAAADAAADDDLGDGLGRLSGSAGSGSAGSSGQTFGFEDRRTITHIVKLM